MGEQIPCRSCGEMNYASDSQCMECGADLTAPGPAPAEAKRPVGSPTPRTAPVRQDGPAAKGQSNTLRTIIGAVVAIVVVSGAVFLWVKHKQAQAKEMRVAAGMGEVSTVERLLDAGVSIDAPNKGNAYTALHFAATGGEQATAALLIQRGADVNALGTDGATPLDLATKMRAVMLEAGNAQFAAGCDAVARLLEQNGGTRAQQ